MLDAVTCTPPDASSEATLHEHLNVFQFRKGSAYPTRLQIETTSRCNLQCPNCRRTIDFPDATQSQTADELMSIEKLLPHLDEIVICGWGESLMGRSLETLLGMARRAKVATYITTNGTLLTETKCRMLIEKQVANVTVSVDAGTPEGYARLRPGGVPFGKVIEGVKRLIRMRGEAASACPGVNLAMVYWDDSAAELIPLLRLVGERIPEIQLVHLQVLYFSDFNPEGKNYKLSRKSIGILDDARQLALQLGITLLVDIPERMELDMGRQVAGYENFYSFPTVEEIRERDLVPTCNSAWQNPFIDSTGNIYPCCVYPESFGNLKQSSFEEIWHGPKFREMRLGLHNGHPSEMCRNCRKTMWYPNRYDTRTPPVARMEEPGLIGMGWYDPQKTELGVPFRWGRDRCDVFLGYSGQPLLFLEAAAMPEGQTIEVSINGDAIGTIKIEHEWNVYTMRIPKHAEDVLQVGLKSLLSRKDPGDEGVWWAQRTIGVAVVQIGLCGYSQLMGVTAHQPLLLATSLSFRRRLTIWLTAMTVGVIARLVALIPSTSRTPSKP